MAKHPPQEQHAALLTTSRSRNQIRWGILKDIRRNPWLYIMLTPVLLYFTIFHYYPMYGALIAFKDFSPRLGIMGSPWVG
ncbi:hypothetical protein Q8G71_35495, partial [Klebsiella pneumoniae]